MNNIIKQLKSKGYTKWKISKKLNVHWNTVNMWEKETFKPTKEKQIILQSLLDS